MGFELFLRWQKLIGKNNSSFTLELEKILLNNSSERLLEAAQDEIKDILDRFWNDVLYRLSFHELENSEEVQPWIEIQIILSEKVPKLNFTNYHYPIVYQAIKDQYFHEEKGLEPSILINLLTEASILAGPITPQATKFYPLPESDNNPKLIKQLTLLCYLIHCQLTEKQKTLIPFLIHFRPTINSDELKIRARKIVNCLLSKETLLHFMFTDEETNQIMASSIDKETHSLFQLIALVAKPPQTVSAIVIALNKILQLEELPPNDCLNFSNQLRTIVDIFAFNVEKKALLEKALVCIRLDAYICHRLNTSQKDNSYSPFTMQVKIDAARQKIAELQDKYSSLSYFHQLALGQGDLAKVIDWQLDKFKAEEEVVLSEQNIALLNAAFEEAPIDNLEIYAQKLFELFYPDRATANQTLALALWLKEQESHFAIKDRDLFNKALTFLRCKAYYVYRNNGGTSQSWFSLFSKDRKLGVAENRMNNLRARELGTTATTSHWISFSFLSNYIPSMDSLAANQGELGEILSGQIKHFEKPEQGENIVSFAPK